MKRKDIIEFEIGSMEFGGESSTLIGKRKVKMKGGITGQKVKAIVKKARSEAGYTQREVAAFTQIPISTIAKYETKKHVLILDNVEDVLYYQFLMKNN